MEQTMTQTVLITGASRGIGRQIAVTLAQNGYNIVAVCNKNKPLLDNLCAELSRFNIQFYGYCGDLSLLENISNFIDYLNRKNISIDILINNAGISVVGLIQDLSIEEWNTIWNTNVTSAVFLSKYLIPSFLKSGHGKIINISSVWGNVGASCEVAYSTTKGAVNAFTKALAKELAPSNIQVNAISCGIIDTDMNRHLTKDEKDDIVNDIPAGRIGTPEDIARTVLSIIHSSNYMTGQIITVDGGWI